MCFFVKMWFCMQKVSIQGNQESYAPDITNTFYGTCEVLCLKDLTLISSNTYADVVLMKV